MWLLPLLAFEPRPSLLLLTVLLPIYYLRFHMVALHMKGLFDNGVVWIEHVPVWGMLAREWWVRRGKEAA